MTKTLAPYAGGDTIFALASGAGRSAIAVMRLSGPLSPDIVIGLCGALPAPRRASLRRLRDASGVLLDQAVVLWQPAPASYTGEDSAELHLHGGRAVLDAVTTELVQAGARPAQPGEFTRRAVLHGKISLLAAEAVADLVEAETETQRNQALRQLSGEQRQVLDRWSAQLTRSLAWQEALIDFTEDDVPASAEQDMLLELAQLQRDMRAELGASARAERLRRGLVFVIVGAPNVGKSSLLNALAGRAAAIVSPTPGTTRDAIQVDLVLGGIPVTVIDTAGLRQTEDAIEAEGVRRAGAHAASADMVIEVSDRGQDATWQFDTALHVSSKIDVVPAAKVALGISVTNGAGLPDLMHHLAARAADLADPGHHPVVNRQRHATSLRDAEASVAMALRHTNGELRAEELRLAADALGRITGQITTNDILDVVFGAFCIGK